MSDPLLTTRAPPRLQSLWMLVAGLSFALMAIFVKLASADFGTAELVFYRSLISLVVTWVVLAHAGISIRTRRLGMHAHRGVAGFVSLFMFFYALTVLPVATAMTLNYTSPVFLALLLAVLARAVPGRRLTGTILLGFVGAVLVLRPVLAGDQVFAGLVGLASGALSAIAYWNVRELVVAQEPEGRVVFYFALFSTLGGLVWMLPQPWTPLTLANSWALLAMGLAGTVGQLTMTRAFGHGKPLTAAALSYSGIVFSSILGIVIFDDSLPLIAWLGIALIVAAGILAVQLTPSTRAAPPPPVTSD